MRTIGLSNAVANNFRSREGGNNRNGATVYFGHAFAIVAIFIIIIFSSLNVSAEDEIFIYDKEKYNEAIPDEAKEYADDAADFSFSEVFVIIKDQILKGMPETFKKIMSLTAVCLCASICSSFCSGLSSGDTVNSACNIIVCVYTVSLISQLISDSIVKSAELSQYSGALSFAMSSFLIFGGNPGSATVLGSSVAVFTAITNLIIKTVIPSLCAILMALTFSSSASGISSVPVKKISSFYIITLTAIMSLISLLVTFQYSAAKSVETVAIKGVKLATCYAIPVVGGMLAEAAETVSGSFSAMKGTFGLGALIVVLVMLIPQILSILAYKLGFCLVRIITDFLSGGSGAVIDCADSLLNVLLTTVVFSSCSFIFCIYLFLGTPLVT